MKGDSNRGAARLRGDSLLKEIEPFACISRETPEKSSPCFLPDRRSRKGYGNRTVCFRLKFLVLNGSLIGAIGVQVHEDEILHPGRDFRLREQISLHPVAIGVGVTRERDEYRFVFVTSLCQCLRILVLEECECRLAPTRRRGGIHLRRWQVGFQLAKSGA